MAVEYDIKHVKRLNIDFTSDSVMLHAHFQAIFTCIHPTFTQQICQGDLQRGRIKTKKTHRLCIFRDFICPFLLWNIQLFFGLHHN